jgi:hypothetical protein
VVVTPVSVEEVRVEPDSALLAGGGLQQPVEGARVAAPSLPLRGWALGSTSRALAVELRDGTRLVGVAPLREPTPDAARLHSDRPEAAHCGFLTRVQLDSIPLDRELHIEVVRADGMRGHLGAIRFAPLEAPQGRPQRERAAPTLRSEVERLILDEAARLNGARGRDAASLLAGPGDPAGDARIEGLRTLDLEGKTVLDASGGLGHLGRAARAQGAALVDVVAPDGARASLARLLGVYHRTTRVFVRDPKETVDVRYDVVLPDHAEVEGG